RDETTPPVMKMNRVILRLFGPRADADRHVERKRPPRGGATLPWIEERLVLWRRCYNVPERPQRDQSGQFCSSPRSRKFSRSAGDRASARASAARPAARGTRARRARDPQRRRAARPDRAAESDRASTARYRGAETTP